jgi:hypothetical protein
MVTAVHCADATSVHDRPRYELRVHIELGERDRNLCDLRVTAIRTDTSVGPLNCTKFHGSQTRQSVTVWRIAHENAR